jgi:hypothetical protein
LPVHVDGKLERPYITAGQQQQGLIDVQKREARGCEG